ncbi:MAG: M20/M25/M40 family metallo-hydrolase [Nanobdellota archaeon]
MRERLKATFLDLVHISEVYPHEDRIIRYIEKRLDEARIRYARDRFNNLIAWVEGSGEPLLVNTHMDIPEPNDSLTVVTEEDRILTDGTTILGADPKAGLAVLLEFLIEMRHSQQTHHPIEAAITRGEEAGLIGATNLDYGMLQARQGIVLDEDGPVTRVITQAPNMIKIDIQVRGKQGHPRDPREGRNVLFPLRTLLQDVPPGYAKAGVTWNLGTITAGSARNTIPGEMNIRAELRGYDTLEVESEYERIQGLLQKSCHQHGLELRFKQAQKYYGYRVGPDSKLLKTMRSVYQQLELTPGFHSTFGGSDANIFNSKGIQTVPIGSAYYNAHQYQEYASIADMEKILEFLDLFYRVQI